MWQLISKLGPRALSVLIVIALLLLAGVIGYAVSVGHPVNFFGLQIGQSNEDLAAKISELQARLNERPTHEQLNELKSQIVKALTPSDLPGIWDPTLSKEEAKSRIIEIKERAASYNELAGGADFVFLKLEREIANSGGAINTNAGTGNEVEVFQLIQSALQSIDAFQGNPNGAQVLTNRSLREFQEAYNAQVPEKRRLKPLGFFGWRTLSVIREEYWKIIQKS